ncbi:hypothetical protein CYG49_04305, partial [Candidatus Saccharibacteria bacterium]
MDEFSSPTEGVVFHAGFPNAAEDARASSLSLDNLIVRHRASTFFWRLPEGGIPEMGWKGGDIAVVDRAVQAGTNDWVVAVIDEVFVIRQYRKQGNRIFLLTPAGQREAAQDGVLLWGVITFVVQQLRSV